MFDCGAFLGGEYRMLRRGKTAMNRKVGVTREEALVTVMLILTGLVLAVCR